MLYAQAMRELFLLGVVGGTLLACGTPPAPVGATDGGNNGNAPPFCVPLSSSQAIDAAASRVLYRDTMIDTASTLSAPSGVSLNRTRSSSGKLTRLTWDANGTADDYTDDFGWDTAGRLYRWTHDADGTSNDFVEDFSYDSGGRLTRWVHDVASGTIQDVTENFSYDSQGRITRSQVDKNSTVQDYTTDVSWNAAGKISRWVYDSDGTTSDYTEDFSYNSRGLISRWTSDRSGTVYDQGADVTYDANDNVTKVATTGGTGLVTVKNCP